MSRSKFQLFIFQISKIFFQKFFKVLQKCSPGSPREYTSFLSVRRFLGYFVVEVLQTLQRWIVSKKFLTLLHTVQIQYKYYSTCMCVCLLRHGHGVDGLQCCWYWMYSVSDVPAGQVRTSGRGLVLLLYLRVVGQLTTLGLLFFPSTILVSLRMQPSA